METRILDKRARRGWAKAWALTALAVPFALGCVAAKKEVKPEADLAAAPKPKVKTAREVFAEGVAAFDAKRHEEAKATFAKVELEAPASVALKYNLGLVSERLGQLVDAAAAYEAAHALDAKHKPTLLNLGRVYRLQDRFDEAIALYETALKEPENEYDVELNNNLAVAYRLAKKFDRAEAAARKVLARTKDNADAYKNLALIYFDQGNYRLAEFISANAKKLDEKDPGVYNNLGLIYLKIDEPRLALGQFQKAVELKGDFAPGLFNLGAMALRYRDYAGAEKALAKAIEVDPTSYEAFLAYGYALDGQKGHDSKKGLSAGQAFERVLAMKPEQPDALCGAAWAYAADKSGWERALTFFERCKSNKDLSGQDRQLIDNKVKGILAMQKSGQPAEPPKAEAQGKAPPPASGPSLIDRASDEAARDEAAAGATPSPQPAAEPAPESAPKPESEPVAPATGVE